MDGRAVSEPVDALEAAEGRWLRWRRRIARNTSLNLAYRIGVGLVGALVLAAGIVAIPYPGPGWLIVFAGLGILASEFEWAYKLLHWARARYDGFMIWFSRQSTFVKALGVLFTTLVVVATLWVLGTFGLVGGWVGLEQSWLESPL